MKEKSKEVYDVVVKYINEQEFLCPESIYQSDAVALTASEFVESLCDIVGYCWIDEETDDIVNVE